MAKMARSTTHTHTPELSSANPQTLRRGHCAAGRTDAEVQYINYVLLRCLDSDDLDSTLRTSLEDWSPCSPYSSRLKPSSPG